MAQVASSSAFGDAHEGNRAISTWQVVMSDSIGDQAVFVRLLRDAAEAEKLAAERDKLRAEARKLHIDRVLAPVIAIGGVLVGLLGVLVAFGRR